MGEEKDLPVGRQLVDYFTPFLLHLAESGLSKRTIQNHVDNMWLLGGEIIREVNQEPRLRKSSAEQLVRNVIHEDGGPLIHNGWETNSAPSTPPAASFTVSSLNSSAETRKLPTDSPDEPYYVPTVV